MVSRRQILAGIAGCLAARHAPAIIGARSLAFTFHGGEKPVDWGGRMVFELAIPDANTTMQFDSVSPNSCPIDWGDGTVDTLRTHVYAEAGDYIVQLGVECTRFYFAWGSSPYQKYLTKVLNVGNNVGSLTYRQFQFNGSMPNFHTLKSVDVAPRVTTMNRFSGNSITDISLPKGFGENIADASSVFSINNINMDFVLPTGFARNATTINGLFSTFRLNSIRLYEGFASTFSSVASCVHMGISRDTLPGGLFLPSGFGAEATEGNTGFVSTPNGAWTFDALTNLHMSGYRNGIRYSFDLSRLPVLTPYSAITIMNSLQPIADGMEPQTITFRTNRQAVFEANADFVASANDLRTNAGWNIAYGAN